MRRFLYGERGTLSLSNPVYLIVGKEGPEGGLEGIVTRMESDKDRAIPHTSNPGPTFAVVAGTCII